MPHRNDNNASGSDSSSRSPRQSRLIKAALVCDRFGHIDVRIRNLSNSGIGGVSDVPLMLGEELIVHLPGHQPMQGIVRWFKNKRFGIETEGEIHVDQLRDAHGSNLVASDSSVEFRIIPPVKGDFRRPPLNMGFENKPQTYPVKKWEL